MELLEPLNRFHSDVMEISQHAAATYAGKGVLLEERCGVELAYEDVEERIRREPLFPLSRYDTAGFE